MRRLPTFLASAVAAGALAAPPAGAKGPAPFDHGAFEKILQTHVRGDRVDYAALRDGDRAAFRAYLDALAHATPAMLPAEADRIAFWINAYNAFTIEGVLANYPLASVRDVSGFWSKTKYRALGRDLTLDAIEHEILRKDYREPRVHFALVCASRSCPRLQPFAFTAKELDGQLDRAARAFLADPTRNRFDRPEREMHLSKIFDWYGGDFAKWRGPGYKAFVAAHVAPPIPAEELGRWDVEFLDYDWGLNDVEK